MRFSLVLLVCLPQFLGAQLLPHSDLILFSANIGNDSIWKLTAPRFLSQFNPDGYNNQPAFINNQEIYLSVQFPNDTTQTDIYALQPASGVKQAIIASPETAEYSPTPMPDGKRFSVIRVEQNGNQRIWSFPLDRHDNGRPEFPEIIDAGYHCWINDTLAGVFIVGKNGQAHQLYAIGLKSQKRLRIASGIGRCLKPLSGNRMAFVAKSTDQTWFLKIWDLRKQSAQIIVKMPTGSEDFAIMPDGTFLAGNKSKLFQYKPGKTPDWLEIADLAKYGIKNISRIATGKDGKIVVVVQ
ncbi:MAG: hypothetical protein KGS48_16490 [Bacteroidetes bacterium]|nr:hypothetical protein [Bacteroidota bacterium]